MPSGVYQRGPYKPHSNGLLGKRWKIAPEKRKNMSRGKGPDSPVYKDGKWSDKKDLKYQGWLKRKNYRLKRMAEGSHTFGEWELLKKQYGYTCPVCNKKEPEIKLTEDHIIPLSKGGSNYIENIQPLCKLCNCRKYTTIIKYEAKESAVKNPKTKLHQI